MIPAVADARLVELAPGRRLRSRHAGLFLFLPLLARLDWPQLVQRAHYPGSQMVPATSALLSLLLLKLLGKERRSHIDDFGFDEGVGLFAGLNVLPKKSFLTEYSYRTNRENQRLLLQNWAGGLSTLLFPQADTFSLDFHPIPHRGEDTQLEKNYLSMEGRARSSVLAFFVLEQGCRVFCYSNANLLHEDQAAEPYRFVEFWHSVTGKDPIWLYFDCKVTTYGELSRLNQRNVQFVTIQRRSKNVLRQVEELPSSAWSKAVIGTSQRKHQHVRYADRLVRLRGYSGEIRQIAITGLGREKPTLLLSNNRKETGRQLIIRYTGRNLVEDGLGSCVDFFQLDRLSSDVRLNADVDAAMTVVAQGCYRWLGQRIKGYAKAKAKRLYRDFVETAGLIEVGEHEIVVTLDRRCHNPLLSEAALDLPAIPIPWLRHLPLRFCYS